VENSVYTHFSEGKGQEERNIKRMIRRRRENGKKMMERRER
jgi:hypothetical protein